MSTLDSPSFTISPTLDALGRWVGEHPDLWIKLGNIESKLLAMEERPIRAPVYISGLARSGSTVLLEILASHPDAACHRYSDFPFLFTPYWWNKLLSLNPLRDTTQRERAHGDGIMVGTDSPEAMEEMLWMAFFPWVHRHDRSHVLDAGTSNRAFEKFYAGHIRKLLLARKGKRYLSKGNYNVARMGYVQKLFPDARFIVPVRDPVTHIESLMRQHARFSDAGWENPRTVRHMSLAGHFEFGLNRIPIHTGNQAAMDAIQKAWDSGNEIRGWALYWDMLHRFIHAQLTDSAMVVRFEDMCNTPRETIAAVLTHSQLADTALVDKWAPKMHKPDYYQSALSVGDVNVIRSITAETATLFGY